MLLVFAVTPVLAFSAGTPPKETRTDLLLGTTVGVTIYGRVNDGVFDQVFERVAEIEAKMSTSEDDYDDTELLRVNASAGIAPVEVSPDTFFVIEQALSIGEMTGGAFDVSVYPVVKLWGIGTEGAQVPAQADIAAATALVDYRKVEADPENRTIYLPEPGMGIDVGGIAKGYAADEAARILREAGVEHGLLDFGGNILTIGTKPDGSAWRIGIQVPDQSRGEYLGIASVVNLAVVTSGTYERFFVEDGVRYHHIIDTATGYPVRNGLESVTIITEESITADALSTSVFALGLEDGYRFVLEHEGVEALFVTSDKQLYMTPGFGGLFEITSDEYSLAETGPLP
jgi:thiamine biosynthesis lipoprotein